MNPNLHAHGFCDLPGRPVTTLESLPRSSAFLTIDEAAQVLGVSDRTVRRLIRTGKLKSKRHNASTVRIAWDWLLEYAGTPDTPRRPLIRVRHS